MHGLVKCVPNMAITITQGFKGASSQCMGCQLKRTGVTSATCIVVDEGTGGDAGDAGDPPVNIASKLAPASTVDEVSKLNTAAAREPKTEL